MKTVSKLLIASLSIGAAATLLVAQDNPQQGGGNRPPGGQRGQQGGGGQGGQGGQQRPHMPLIEALDANHDHIIDAQEIANAVAALKKLDKNGDGKLTPDEYMGQRPGGGQGGQGGGQGGPGGQRGGQNNNQGQRERPKSE